MLISELLKKIKSGEISSTESYQVKAIRPGTDDNQRYQTYVNLISIIDKGYIKGTPIAAGCLGPNYAELQLTKTGREMYEFLNKPISEFGRPTLFSICKNAIIGAVTSKIVLILIGLIILYFIPNIEVIVKTFIYDILDYLISFLTSNK